MNVELNMKEMLELGKKAQAAGRGGTVEPDTISNGSRCFFYPLIIWNYFIQLIIYLLFSPTDPPPTQL